MPLTDQDLKFKFKLEPDVTKVKEAIKGLSENINGVYSKARKGLEQSMSVDQTGISEKILDKLDSAAGKMKGILTLATRGIDTTARAASWITGDTGLGAGVKELIDSTTQLTEGVQEVHMEFVPDTSKVDEAMGNIRNKAKMGVNIDANIKGRGHGDEGDVEGAKGLLMSGVGTLVKAASSIGIATTLGPLITNKVMEGLRSRGYLEATDKDTKFSLGEMVKGFKEAGKADVTGMSPLEAATHKGKLFGKGMVTPDSGYNLGDVGKEGPTVASTVKKLFTEIFSGGNIVGKLGSALSGLGSGVKKTVEATRPDPDLVDVSWSDHEKEGEFEGVEVVDGGSKAKAVGDIAEKAGGGMEKLGNLMSKGGLLIAGATIAYTVLNKLAGTLGGVMSSGLDATAKGLKMFSGGLKELQGDLGPIGMAMGMVEGTLNALTETIEKIPILGKVLGPLTAGFSNLIGPARDIISTLTQMAGVSSPGSLQHFQMAIQDVQGVIGRTFVPVLNMMREGVRLFGDTLATLLPNLSETSSALAPLREAWRQLQTELRDVVADLGPQLREGFITGLRVLGGVLGSVTRATGYYVRALVSMYAPIANLLGLAGITGSGGMRSSVGAAARPAQITGLEEYQRSLQMSAANLPAGIEEEGADPIAQSADFLGNIWTWLSNIDFSTMFQNLLINPLINWLSGWMPSLDQIANAIRMAIMPGAMNGMLPPAAANPNNIAGMGSAVATGNVLGVGTAMLGMVFGM